MANEKGLMDRIMGVLNSPSLKVVPVGHTTGLERGILRADAGKLRDALKLTFESVVLAAALASSPVAQAAGVGYDANVYGQAQGQVMQAGSAVRMTVLSVRPVSIEVAPPSQRGNSVVGYAVTAAAGGVGAVIGNKIGGESQGGRQIGTILGGLLGAIGGSMANDAMNGPKEARQVEGVEITLVNPASNQIAVVTQAGNQQFSEGDRVLVSSVGGNTRVVADRSHAQQVEAGGGRPQGRSLPAGNAGMVTEVVRSAGIMGIQVDYGKVADLLEKGAPSQGMFVGKIVGVDRENGLVYQSSGRGAGVVHDLNSLSSVPEVGESVTVRFKDGRGSVAPMHLAQGVGRGR